MSYVISFYDVLRAGAPNPTHCLSTLDSWWNLSNFPLVGSRRRPRGGKSRYSLIAAWIGALRNRGKTVPHNGRYALRLFGDALGVRFPLGRPAICESDRIGKWRKAKQAPLTPP